MKKRAEDKEHLHCMVQPKTKRWLENQSVKEDKPMGKLIDELCPRTAFNRVSE